MTITRANLEALLVARRGPLMSAATMAVTVAGSNADLNDPIGYAIRYMGGTVADISSVTSVDLATVDFALIDGVFDVAELRLLRTIKGRLDMVDIRTGPFTESLSQLAESVEQDIQSMSEQVVKKYGAGSILIDTGNLSLDFAEHNDDLPGDTDD